MSSYDISNRYITQALRRRRTLGVSKTRAGRAAAFPQNSFASGLPGADAGPVDDQLSWERTARVSQAAGMVSVQAGCCPDHALSLMADRAVIEHITLLALALAVIEHTIRFN